MGGAAARRAIRGQGATAPSLHRHLVTWIGARNENSGIALVSWMEVRPSESTYARPNEPRTPIITLHDLSPGSMLTIEVTAKRTRRPANQPCGRGGGCFRRGSADRFAFSGPASRRCLHRHRRLRNTAQILLTTPPSGAVAPSHRREGRMRCDVYHDRGRQVTLTFRGTSITWQSGLGPDFGIASVQLDGGAPQIRHVF